MRLARRTLLDIIPQNHPNYHKVVTEWRDLKSQKLKTWNEKSNTLKAMMADTTLKPGRMLDCAEAQRQLNLAKDDYYRFSNKYDKKMMQAAHDHLPPRLHTPHNFARMEHEATHGQFRPFSRKEIHLGGDQSPSQRALSQAEHLRSSGRGEGRSLPKLGRTSNVEKSIGKKRRASEGGTEVGPASGNGQHLSHGPSQGLVAAVKSWLPASTTLPHQEKPLAPGQSPPSKKGHTLSENHRQSKGSRTAPRESTRHIPLLAKPFIVPRPLPATGRGPGAFAKKFNHLHPKQPSTPSGGKGSHADTTSGFMAFREARERPSVHLDQQENMHTRPQPFSGASVHHLLQQRHGSIRPEQQHVRENQPALPQKQPLVRGTGLMRSGVRPFSDTLVNQLLGQGHPTAQKEKQKTLLNLHRPPPKPQEAGHEAYGEQLPSRLTPHEKATIIWLSNLPQKQNAFHFVNAQPTHKQGHPPLLTYQSDYSKHPYVAQNSKAPEYPQQAGPRTGPGGLPLPQNSGPQALSPFRQTPNAVFQKLKLPNPPQQTGPPMHTAFHGLAQGTSPPGQHQWPQPQGSNVQIPQSLRGSDESLPQHPPTGQQEPLSQSGDQTRPARHDSVQSLPSSLWPWSRPGTPKSLPSDYRPASDVLSPSIYF